MRKFLSVVSVLVGFVFIGAVAGCNTIEGMGKDIKKSGEVIEKAADKAKS